MRSDTTLDTAETPVIQGPDAHGPAHVGYVVKMYPRFSETFVVTEILAREAQGERVSVFGLRPPNDPHFHADLARVAAPVTQFAKPATASSQWRALRDGARDPRVSAGISAHLDELLAALPEDAVQAVSLARGALDAGVTHLHAHFANCAAVVTRLASLITGIPYSFTAHAKDLFHDDVDELALGRMLRDAHHTVTVSDYNLAWLRERHPLAAARTVRCYNGLDLDRFPMREPRARRADAPLHLVAVGRLVEKKGFAQLLDAVAALRASGRPTTLEIAGGGELRSELEARIRMLGLDDAVTLLGPVPQHALRAVLERADVFVAPCVVGADGNTDGLPTVLLEAMATGVPVVATAVTGIPEAVRDGDTGVLVPPGDVDALASGIVRVADGGSEVDAMTVRARRLVEREFDVRRLAAQLAALVRDGVDAPASVAEAVA